MTYLGIERAILAVQDAQQPVGTIPALEYAAASTAAREIISAAFPAAAARIDAMAARFETMTTPIERIRAQQAGRAAATMVLAGRDDDQWCTVVDESVIALGGGTTARGNQQSPWLAAAPFALKNVAQFDVRLPYWTTIDGTNVPDPLIVRATIFDKVDRLTPPREIAQFWSGSPVVAWNQVAQTVSAACGLSVAERAHVLAVVNVAIADATLATLHQQRLSRNGQPQWRERLVPTDEPPAAADVTLTNDASGEFQAYRLDARPVITPPLRRYPSLAAAVASAACAALGGVPNIGHVPFELSPVDRTGVAGASRRKFSNIGEAARECAYAASASLDNSREACVAGYYFGVDIGRYVLKRMPPTSASRVRQ